MNTYVPVVVEFHEAESVLDNNVAEAAVRLEELLNVPLADRRGDVAQENTGAGRHRRAFLVEIFAPLL